MDPTLLESMQPATLDRFLDKRTKEVHQTGLCKEFQLSNPDLFVCMDHGVRSAVLCEAVPMQGIGSGEQCSFYSSGCGKCVKDRNVLQVMFGGGAETFRSFQYHLNEYYDARKKDPDDEKKKKKRVTVQNIRKERDAYMRCVLYGEQVSEYIRKEWHRGNQDLMLDDELQAFLDSYMDLLRSRAASNTLLCEEHGKYGDAVPCKAYKRYKDECFVCVQGPELSEADKQKHKEDARLRGGIRVMNRDLGILDMPI